MHEVRNPFPRDRSARKPFAAGEAHPVADQCAGHSPEKVSACPIVSEVQRRQRSLGEASKHTPQAPSAAGEARPLADQCTAHSPEKVVAYPIVPKSRGANDHQQTLASTPLSRLLRTCGLPHTNWLGTLQQRRSVKNLVHDLFECLLDALPGLSTGLDEHHRICKSELFTLLACHFRVRQIDFVGNQHQDGVLISGILSHLLLPESDVLEACP
mmetsp:Transcript_44353/g.117652  ORF Transcript_44353/g.117652 Transcript_44353/m.117652 type:complete len:213 (+) Transcript_44353:27-665(+)